MSTNDYSSVPQSFRADNAAPDTSCPAVGEAPIADNPEQALPTHFVKTVPEQTLRRLPVYLHLLYSLREKRNNISATAISEYFGLNDVQVRKDLGAVSGSGRPKTGYVIEELISQIHRCIGYLSNTKTVLIGAGNLGKALMSYGGFSDYGLDIIAAFDSAPELVGTLVSGKPVLSMGDLETVCTTKGIRLGIITVPVAHAQSVCNMLVDLGIEAIWNFAPTILRVPDGVYVENENLASSLAILSRHLNTQSKPIAGTELSADTLKEG